MADFRTIIVGGIKLYLFGETERKGEEGKKGNEIENEVSIIFVCHGRMGDSSKVFPLCKELIKNKKIIAIAFDQRNHGERLVDKSQNGGWENPSHIIDMYSMQYGTSKDISYLIDTLPLFLSFKPKSYGVVGVSLGGHVTLISMANDLRISFGVSIIGCADYRGLMKHRVQVNEKDRVEEIFNERFNSHLQSLLMQVDPINRCLEFKDRPLLFLCGEIDELVPASCSFEFVNQLKSIYSVPQKIQMKIYPNVGHQLTKEMIQDSSNWCSQWCLPIAQPQL